MCDTKNVIYVRPISCRIKTIISPSQCCFYIELLGGNFPPKISDSPPKVVSDLVAAIHYINLIELIFLPSNVISDRPAPNVLEIVTYYILLELSPIILLYLAYYSKIILRRYTCIRNTSFKIVESNEVKSLVLAANHKQGTI